MDKYVFGIDIGGTSIKLGLFTETGELMKKWQIPTCITDKGSHILLDIVKEIKKTISENMITSEQVAGIGIGVPGPVDNNNTVYGCVNLGWDILNVRDRMNQLLPNIPKVIAGNDAGLATIGEVWKGAGKGYNNVAMLTLGTGVGGGIVINNRMLSGSHGGAGEWSHMKVDSSETVSCNCGNRGCLEQYASARGIVRLGRRMLKNTNKPSKLREMKYFSAKDICDLARDGEEMALDIIKCSCDYLGKAMSSIACVSDPDVFLIGGGMSRAGDVLLDEIRKSYQKHAFSLVRNIPIKIAKLGNDAGIFGCVRIILNP